MTHFTRYDGRRPAWVEQAGGAIVCLLLGACAGTSGDDGDSQAADVGEADAVSAVEPDCVATVEALEGLLEAEASGEVEGADVFLCDGARLSGPASIEQSVRIIGGVDARWAARDVPVLTVAASARVDVERLTIEQRGSAAGVAVESGATLSLTDVRIDVDQGVGLRAVDAASIELDGVVVSTGDGHAAVAGVLLERVARSELRDVTTDVAAPVGIGASGGALTAESVRVSGPTATGMALSACSATLRDVRIEAVGGAAPTETFGLTAVDADVEARGLVIRDVQGVGLLARRSIGTATEVGILNTAREGLAVEASTWELLGSFVAGTRHAGVRAAEASDLLLEDVWIVETLSGAVADVPGVFEGDGLLVDDDGSDTTVALDRVTVFGAARASLNLAGRAATLESHTDVALCTAEERAARWACDEPTSLACERAGFELAEGYACLETATGTRCDGGGGGPPAQPIAADAVAACGDAAATRPDDGALARALTAGADGAAWWERGADDVRLRGSMRPLPGWACDEGTCTRVYGTPNPGNDVDVPTGATTPGWSCEQADGARTCTFVAVPWFDPYGRVSPDSVSLSPTLALANLAYIRGSVRPGFRPLDPRLLGEVLGDVGSRIPLGIIGENGPIGRPDPDECDDGTPRASCTCGCVPGGCARERRFFRDEDGDGFGTEEVTVERCSPPTGFIERAGDCSDRDALSHPDGVEVWDARDNDCDGGTDDVGLLWLQRYRTERSAFDWVHTFASVPPAGAFESPGQIALFPENVCEHPQFAPSDECRYTEATEDQNAGWAVWIAAGTLTALSECRGLLGTKQVALYLLETDGEYRGYNGRGELACTRLGYTYTPSLAEGLGIGVPMYRLQSGFEDPGKGDVMWSSDPEGGADETYGNLGLRFYAVDGE